MPLPPDTLCVFSCVDEELKHSLWRGPHRVSQSRLAVISAPNPGRPYQSHLGLGSLFYPLSVSVSLSVSLSLSVFVVPTSPSVLD